MVDNAAESERDQSAANLNQPSEKRAPENADELFSDGVLQPLDSMIRRQSSASSSLSSVPASESNFNALISHDSTSTPTGSKGMSILMNNGQSSEGILCLVSKSSIF